MKIGILLCSSPESQDGHTVGRLAEGLLAGGHQLSVFLMDDGVYHAARHAGPAAPGKPGYSALDLAGLIERGAKVALCAVTAKARGVAESQLYPAVEWSSQYELAQIVKESDRFLAFG